jgi:putative two-component system response regulator
MSPAETHARVLVVDDSEAQQDLLRRVLAQDDHDVHAVSDGRQALAVAADEDFDVVLLDVELPGLNGLQVCRILKASPRTRLTPVLIQTGLLDHATMLGALEAGADDVLAKPVGNAELRARVRSAIRLKRLVDELDNVQGAMLMLATTIEARDPYTKGHCDRLAEYGVALGQRIGLPADDLGALRRGGYLHDIGKVAVPDTILFKPGPLTPAEFETVKSHSVVGDQICAPLTSLARVRPIIRSHHERLDGCGYPDGLRGDAVPLLAQILSVVDVFDALTTNRPYRKPLPVEEALDCLQTEAENGIRDGALVREFAAVVASGLRPPALEPPASWSASSTAGTRPAGAAPHFS